MQRNVRRVALRDGFIGQNKQQPAELATLCLLRQSSADSCLFDIQLSGSAKPVLDCKEKDNFVGLFDGKERTAVARMLKTNQFSLMSEISSAGIVYFQKCHYAVATSLS